MLSVFVEPDQPPIYVDKMKHDLRDQAETEPLLKMQAMC